MIALHSVLREGQELAYDREHARIGADLLASLQGAGIRNWIIWRSGRDLFHAVDCDDFAAAMATLADDPVNQRWQEHMAGFVDHFVFSAADPEQPELPQVWDLSAQAAEG